MPAIKRQRTIKIKQDLEEFERAVAAQAEDLAEDLGKRMIDHVWEAYDRPTTGKGFTNRTFNLRKSIRADVDVHPNKVVLRMRAGMHYASYVEGIKDGMYAYLGPTIDDMLPVAESMIAERMKVATVYQNKMKKAQGRYLELLAKGRAAEKAERMGR